jgi:hypothetical protein
MNCYEAEPFVSVLYDGELAPVEAARHVGACPNCRARLLSYSEMGAELRLMASLAPDHPVSPPALRDKLRPVQQPARFAFLRARVLMPRFAVALLAAAFVAASVSIMVLRAQSESRPLWFQFGLDLKGSGSSWSSWMTHVAQAGYDDGLVLWMVGNQTGVHIAVSAIKEGSVQLGIRARKLSPAEAAKGFAAKKELGDLRNHAFTYIIGEKLEIPVEGSGGTLVLQGKVVDHEPKIAWGLPVEPGPEQLVLTSPLVISGDAVIANLQGCNSIAEGRNWAGRIYVPGMGQLRIALRSFPEAVQGEANWGDLKFKWQGRSYSVRAASPITGGAQPRAVWVAVGSDHVPDPANFPDLGTAPLAPVP